MRMRALIIKQLPAVGSMGSNGNGDMPLLKPSSRMGGAPGMNVGSGGQPTAQCNELWAQLQHLMHQRETAIHQRSADIAAREQHVQQQAAKYHQMEQLLAALSQHVQYLVPGEASQQQLPHASDAAPSQQRQQQGQHHAVLQVMQQLLEQASHMRTAAHQPATANPPSAQLQPNSTHAAAVASARGAAADGDASTHMQLPQLGRVSGSSPQQLPPPPSSSSPQQQQQHQQQQQQQQQLQHQQQEMGPHHQQSLCQPQQQHLALADLQALTADLQAQHAHLQRLQAAMEQDLQQAQLFAEFLQADASVAAAFECWQQWRRQRHQDVPLPPQQQQQHAPAADVLAGCHQVVPSSGVVLGQGPSHQSQPPPSPMSQPTQHDFLHSDHAYGQPSNSSSPRPLADPPLAALHPTRRDTRSRSRSKTPAVPLEALQQHDRAMQPAAEGVSSGPCHQHTHDLQQVVQQGQGRQQGQQHHQQQGQLLVQQQGQGQQQLDQHEAVPSAHHNTLVGGKRWHDGSCFANGHVPDKDGAADARSSKRQQLGPTQEQLQGQDHSHPAIGGDDAMAAAAAGGGGGGGVAGAVGAVGAAAAADGRTQGGVAVVEPFPAGDGSAAASPTAADGTLWPQLEVLPDAAAAPAPAPAPAVAGGGAAGSSKHHMFKPTVPVRAKRLILGMAAADDPAEATLVDAALGDRGAQPAERVLKLFRTQQRYSNKASPGAGYTRQCHLPEHGSMPVSPGQQQQQQPFFDQQQQQQLMPQPPGEIGAAAQGFDQHDRFDHQPYDAAACDHPFLQEQQGQPVGQQAVHDQQHWQQGYGQLQSPRAWFASRQYGAGLDSSGSLGAEGKGFEPPGTLYAAADGQIFYHQSQHEEEQQQAAHGKWQWQQGQQHQQHQQHPSEMGKKSKQKKRKKKQGGAGGDKQPRDGATYNKELFKGGAASKAASIPQAANAAGNSRQQGGGPAGNGWGPQAVNKQKGQQGRVGPQRGMGPQHNRHQQLPPRHQQPPRPPQQQRPQQPLHQHQHQQHQQQQHKAAGRGPGGARAVRGLDADEQDASEQELQRMVAELKQQAAAVSATAAT